MKTMKTFGVLVFATVGLSAIGGWNPRASAGQDKSDPGAVANSAPAAPSAMPPTNQLSLDLGNKVTMKIALIPSGKFMMGSPKDEKGRRENEGPRHEVTICKAFYMGLCEVTQEQYEQVMGKNPSHFKESRNPVEQVSWEDAVEFCKALSKKTGKSVSLPTEAQWEYACRAGSKTRFSYGDDNEYAALGDYAWYNKNSEGRTHPAGQKKPNDWGLYDMHGNVWEWCSDWYDKDYYSAKANDRDPQGPGSGTCRLLRCGSCACCPLGCRSAMRRGLSPDSKFDYIGFRVSVDMK
jgi:formylglycine-generating enzyme required for sulfatase activity